MPRQKSYIWEYFSKREGGAAVCDICNRSIAINGGSTSNLIKHVRSKHKDLLPDPLTANEEIDLKEEYILLQGEHSENYGEFIEDENNKEEMLNESQYEEVAPPKAKKEKLSDEGFRMRPMYMSEAMKRPSLKNNSREKEKDDSHLEIFAKYMVSLMKDMPKKQCEQAQLKIVSLILEAKTEENAAETNEN